MRTTFCPVLSLMCQQDWEKAYLDVMIGPSCANKLTPHKLFDLLKARVEYLDKIRSCFVSCKFCRSTLKTYLSSKSLFCLKRFWLFSRSPLMTICSCATLSVMSTRLFMRYSKRPTSAVSTIPSMVKPSVSISFSSPASRCRKCSLKASLRKLEPLRQPCKY
jgi:hypothetical protein